MQCPNCRTESDGRFCPSCGTPLAGATCKRCGAALVAGARYCTQCGDGARSTTINQKVPWAIAAVATVALAVVMILQIPRDNAAPPMQVGSPAGMPGNVGAPPGMGAPPPLTGTLREQADRLFNRVMQEREAGNMDQAAFFLPMAVDAYRAVEELDVDGLYHLSILETAKGETQAARATAERILESQPEHLLGLAAAADAALQAGDTTAARNFYQRFLDNYETESAKQIREYIDHARILPEYRSTAEAAVGGG